MTFLVTKTRLISFAYNTGSHSLVADKPWTLTDRYKTYCILSHLLIFILCCNQYFYLYLLSWELIICKDSAYNWYLTPTFVRRFLTVVTYIFILTLKVCRHLKYRKITATAKFMILTDLGEKSRTYNVCNSWQTVFYCWQLHRLHSHRIFDNVDISVSMATVNVRVRVWIPWRYFCGSQALLHADICFICRCWLYPVCVHACVCLCVCSSLFYKCLSDVECKN